MDSVTQDAMVVPLPAQLDQKAAQALAETLLAARGRPVRLDGAAVQRLGGQSLQVLLAGARAWAEDGLGFVIAPCSSELGAGLALFGADEKLTCAPEGAA
jgi:anti-anti-sigma regulatory factor